MLKGICVSPGICLPCIFYRLIQNVFKCSWMPILTPNPPPPPRLVLRFREIKAIPLLPFWVFMAPSRVKFTFVIFPVNQDFQKIQSWIKLFYCNWCYTPSPPPCLHGVNRDAFKFTFTTAPRNQIHLYLDFLCSMS